MKKKNFFSILTVMLISIATVSFYGCDKDNGNGNGNGNGGGDNPPAGKTDPSSIAAANLVVYMPFESEDKILEKGTGITFTKVAYEEGGTAPTFPSGRRGNCYKGADKGFVEFDLAASNPFSTMTEYSIAFWLKAPNAGAKYIFSLNGGTPGDQNWGSLEIFTDNGNAEINGLRMKGYIWNDNLTTWQNQYPDLQDEKFTPERWFHFVETYDSETSMLTYYANGVQVTQVELWGGPDTEDPRPGYGAIKFVNETALRIGANNILATNPTAAEDWMGYFEGEVDELRVYNKGLTETEVKALYDAEVENID